MTVVAVFVLLQGDLSHCADMKAQQHVKMSQKTTQSKSNSFWFTLGMFQLFCVLLIRCQHLANYLNMTFQFLASRPSHRVDHILSV